jgi:DNA repair photolyase
VYCALGETPVLMADGRTKPLSDVRIGETIYGTQRVGHYRRYTPTTVTAHWQTVKPAYRVTLEDGTELISSGDHRFLTGRGWKYITGTEHGSARRPHLTLRSELLGVGGFAEPPKDSPDYRRGYLCGMIRGDGHICAYSYWPRSGPANIWRFRLALADEEALSRTSDYLARVGISTTEFKFADATGPRRRIMAIRNSRRDDVRTIDWLIGWPRSPSDDWRKGFLAGIFDAEGSCSRGIFRISNTDQAIVGWTMSCMASFGFDVVTEPVKHANGLVVMRLRGGLRERLRFFHTADPAITRKRTIDGVAIKSDANLKVASIEPLGLELPMYDITTGTGDYISNGVVSHNCFARNTHTYLDFDSGHDFNSKIVVKVNAPERVRKELGSARWSGEHIAMGTNVDCYQRAEGRYRLMPGILTALRDYANPFSILTKGTLILRDLELLIQAAEVTDVSLAVSVGCTDRDLWRLLESGTPSPRARLEVCAALGDQGLGCAVLMGPVVPFLSDSPAQLDETVRQVAQAGARSVTPIVLHLRTGAREWFFRWLREHHAELVPRYQALYGRGAYAPKAYQERVAAQVRELAERHGVGRDRPGGRRPDASTVPSGPASRRDISPRWRARGGVARTDGNAGSSGEPAQLPLL